MVLFAGLGDEDRLFLGLSRLPGRGLLQRQHGSWDY
jgi:hypothetical protein